MRLGQPRIEPVERLAQSAIQGVDRSVALLGRDFLGLSDDDLDHGHRADLGGGRGAFTQDAEAFQPEEGLVGAQRLADQQLEAAIGALELIALVLKFLEPFNDTFDDGVVLVDVRRQLADAVDDRAAPGHLAHQEAARVAHGLGGNMFKGDRALLDPVHVHAGLVGEGLAPDERHVVDQEDVGHLGHAPHGGGQQRQAGVGDAGVAQLELQVADQAR